MELKMLNILIVGTEATSYVFRHDTNEYFDDRDMNIQFLSEQQISKIDFEKISRNSYDIIVFDMIMDVINEDENELPTIINKLVHQFEQFFPKSKLIYNQTRYADKTLINNKWDYDNEYPINSFIKNYDSYFKKRNSILEDIDKIIIDQKHIGYVPYNNDKYGLEYENRNNLTRIFNYSQSYFVEKISKFYELTQGYDNIPSLTRLIYPEPYKQTNSDMLLVDRLNVYNVSNDSNAYGYASKIILDDYVLDGIFGQTARFVLRTKFYRSSMRNKFDINYLLEVPEGNKYNKGIKNIIFYFYGLNWKFDPNGREHFSPSYLHPNLFRSVVPDTVIIRIADVNFLTGSWYRRTPNNLNYEENIKRLIDFFQAQYNVSNENTILFGVSRGAYASLYYSKKLDLPSVCVAPPIDVQLFRNGKKTADFYDVWSEPFNFFKSEKKQKNPKIIIDDASVESTYFPLTEIKDSTTFLFNIDRSTPIEHGAVAGLSVPLQYSLINGLITGFINIDSLQNWSTRSSN
ncbi:XcbB/CpsF family capsular polysaccharide biosynthesis protein [uncultured Weissella sp.]|uniref:XcbB/CpsF family capsular polysaccharide biosynthesis protein n=1 Tax=uncultured Weissella sp. TaxID=253243 RepID=UPI002582B3E3|nr:XcbB/CpsF family capsular polysaccharide biosynthesis protein [uncultured Weissella sp.]